MSMGFDYFSGLAKEWDSQSPFSWNINCPSNGHGFLESLPCLKKIVEKYKSENDFDIFAKVLDKTVCSDLKIDPFRTSIEARHYLTIAFSEYTKRQLYILKKNMEWPWYKWIKSHKNEIKSAFSLNYDLLLESILDDVGREYYSFQLNHHGYGIPLVKPHGSVDFEIQPNSIVGNKPIYPLQNNIDLNDTSIIRLNIDDLANARVQPLCIVPNESNKYSDYQWVEPANKMYKLELAGCTHCVFIGISYWECDRPEIDSILDALPKSAQIIVANPNPPVEFLEKVKGRPVMKWESYDGPIDMDNNLLFLKELKTGKTLQSCFCRSGLSYRYCCGLKTQ